MQDSKVALIFIFNHKYDKNIEVLEKMYKERFSNIYHLVPFYDGIKENVITVYESSQYFQGYLAQGFNRYFSEKYDHYIFIGDDLILNPFINENNYKENFHLGLNDNFIPEVHLLHHLKNNETLRFLPVKSITGRKRWHWCKIKEFIEGYTHKAYGVENANEMPTYSEAQEQLKKNGFEIMPVGYKDLYGDIIPFTSAAVTYFKNLFRYFKTFPLPYPVVGSYSDVVIVAKANIKKFSHYCGVFATNKLFVEFALPTALLLSTNCIVTEADINRRGDIYWLYTPEEINNYNEKIKPYNNNIATLMQNYPTDKLYIHPIKLSKWK